MKCPYCETEMKEGKVVLTFQMSDSEIVVVHDVPALVCEQCGEEFVGNDSAKKSRRNCGKSLSRWLKNGLY